MKIVRTTALLVALFGISLAGCQESDDESASAPAAAATAPAAAGPGVVTVTWRAPDTNEDGTPLVDLAGFRIRYGTTYGRYPNEVSVSNPGATSHVVTGLTKGLHYFVVSAVNQSGQEGLTSKPQRIQVD